MKTVHLKVGDVLAGNISIAYGYSLKVIYVSDTGDMVIAERQSSTSYNILLDAGTFGFITHNTSFAHNNKILYIFNNDIEIEEDVFSISLFDSIFNLDRDPNTIIKLENMHKLPVIHPYFASDLEVGWIDSELLGEYHSFTDGYYKLMPSKKENYIHESMKGSKGKGYIDKAFALQPIDKDSISITDMLRIDVDYALNHIPNSSDSLKIYVNDFFHSVVGVYIFIRSTN